MVTSILRLCTVNGQWYKQDKSFGDASAES
jgi:hypothetical protein